MTATNGGSVIVQEPQGKASRLFLLFHGVGSDAPNLAPLGRVLAQVFPQAAVVSVAAPHVSDFGTGRQWFSVSGVTEENRAARVEAAMPAFVAAVGEWQRKYNVAPEATALVGFSQGSIMALESARLGKALAGRIVAFAGRFAVFLNADDMSELGVSEGQAVTLASDTGRMPAVATMFDLPRGSAMA
ncbi:MAG: hypothetical protein V4787_09505, partial [Pseudomonadota bacterium]